jgi:hypothetical protein
MMIPLKCDSTHKSNANVSLFASKAKLQAKKKGRIIAPYYRWKGYLLSGSA